MRSAETALYAENVVPTEARLFSVRPPCDGERRLSRRRSTGVYDTGDMGAAADMLAERSRE